MHPNALMSLIESVAPLSRAASWDHCGVQIAAHRDALKTVCVALDPTPDTVRCAVDMKADFLLCHHPVTLAPKLPGKLDGYHRILSLALTHDLWIYSAHTSLDANPDGPVNWLGRSLSLHDMRTLQVTSRQSRTLVRLLDNNDIGKVSQSAPHARPDGDHAAEFLLWPEELALFRSDLGPQTPRTEQPVTGATRDFGFGCIGVLPQPLSWLQFTSLLREKLGASWRTIGPAPKTVRTVSYCPGSGADLGQTAFAGGADVYLTGDVKYHQAQTLQDLGVTLDVGHFCLEEAMMRVWSRELAAALAPQGVEVAFLPGHDPFDRYLPGNSPDQF